MQPTKYEFTMAASRTIPYEKPQIWDAGSAVDDKRNVLKIIAMAAPHIMEFKLSKFGQANIRRNLQMINGVVYFKWGLWDASHLTDADFEKTSDNFADQQTNRSLDHFIAEIWIPAVKPIRYRENKIPEIVCYHWKAPADINEIIDLVEKGRADDLTTEIIKTGTGESIAASYAVYFPVGDMDGENWHEIELDNCNNYLQLEDNEWSLT